MFFPVADAPAVPVVEDELVARAQGGDGQAFRQLFQRHAVAVHRFLRDLMRDGAAADEATQETFVRAHRQLGSLGKGQVLRPWLFGIARNVFREQRRRRWFERQRHVEIDAPEALESVPEPEGHSPEHALLARERFAQLERALATLSEDRRAALLLRFDHGLSCQEVSLAMGWSVAKVKIEVFRARAQLRAAMGEEEGA